MKIVVGDYNAQIGKESAYKPTIGHYSLHERSNDNGKRLISFAASKDLLVGSTYFPHRHIYLGTWRKHGPHGRITTSQIDHVLVSKKHRSSLLDVRSYRGANADTDHYMVVAKIRARISLVREHRTTARKKFDTSKLKNEENSSRFLSQLGHKLRDIHTAENLDKKWELCRDALTTTAMDVLGTEVKQKRNPWFDDECQVMNSRKNEAYKRMIQARRTRRSTEEYQALRREETHLRRRKKRQWENRILEDIEELYQEKNCRKFFQQVNEGRRPFKPRVHACRAEDGSLITDKQGILDRWADHFETLLNRGSAEEDFRWPAENEALEGDHLDPPDEEEIQAALEKLRNNKSPGIDNIPAELLKHGGQELVNFFQDLLHDIWAEERLPVEWKTTVIFPIHKKGDTLSCGNYRGISLLPSAYKILSVVLFNRLLPYAEREIGRYQCGFRRGKSTINQIFTLRMLLEKTREYKIATHHIFVDFQQAYDSVNRAEVYRAMLEMNLPPKLVRLTRLTMEDNVSYVRVCGELSGGFPTRTGVRQGDGLACLVFNLALEKAVRDSGIQTTGTIINNAVQLLGFADDIDVAGRSLAAVKEAFIALKNAAMRMGLIVNYNKTKYMCINPIRVNAESHIQAEGQCIERVEEFIYLGSQVNYQNDIGAEIDRRIMSANRCYFALQKHLRGGVLSKSAKVRLYKTLIRPVLTYAAENWTLTQAQEVSLLRLERKILRRIYGPVCVNGEWRRRNNNELGLLYKEINVVDYIKLARLRWAGHLVRMGPEEIPAKVFREQIFGVRRAGRPRLRWEDCVASDARSILDVQNWKAAALDRENWRSMLEQAKTRLQGR